MVGMTHMEEPVFGGGCTGVTVCCHRPKHSILCISDLHCMQALISMNQLHVDQMLLHVCRQLFAGGLCAGLIVQHLPARSSSP